MRANDTTLMPSSRILAKLPAARLIVSKNILMVAVVYRPGRGEKCLQERVEARVSSGSLLGRKVSGTQIN